MSCQLGFFKKIVPYLVRKGGGGKGNGGGGRIREIGAVGEEERIKVMGRGSGKWGRGGEDNENGKREKRIRVMSDGVDMGRRRDQGNEEGSGLGKLEEGQRIKEIGKGEGQGNGEGGGGEAAHFLRERRWQRKTIRCFSLPFPPSAPFPAAICPTAMNETVKRQNFKGNPS